MATASAADVPRTGRSVALWAGVLGAPAAWGLQLQLTYMLVPWACKHDKPIVLHLVTLVFLLLTLAGGFLSWRDWKTSRRRRPRLHPGRPPGRTRFLGGLGMVTSGLFVLIIIAQGIASFFFSPCWS